MANGFGSLYIGSSALQAQQNAINTVANNLTNVNTTGYVRQQVVFSDKVYNTFASAAVSNQSSGTGVTIGDIVHARDIFLDKAYRTQSGRSSFYSTSYDITSEVETLLQETDGEAFQNVLESLYSAISEFAKDPSDSANLNLLMQQASLFLTRSSNLYSELQDLQSDLNSTIVTDVDRINEIGKQLVSLNKQIQTIESAGVETAMDLRDTRDALLDELSTYCSISYSEDNNGVVTVEIEGTEFVTESYYNEIALYYDKATGFKTPYWPQLSDEAAGKYTNVFNLNNISAENNNDVGELKALLLARGDSFANYTDMLGLNSIAYESTLANSVLMNTEAELDTLFHALVTAINDALCPNVEASEALGSSVSYPLTATTADGQTITITSSTLILDADNCAVGSDGELPPQELFTRIGCERYTTATVTIDGEEKTIYIYNEEDTSDISTCYSLGYVELNAAIVADSSVIPHLNQDGSVAYDMAANLAAAWDEESLYVNPSDDTPCSFTDFYSKWVGELGTTGSLYNSMASTLSTTVDTIDNNRQSVIGVSSDEELTNLIRYQQGYNAASRYINVVCTMIDYLLSSL